MYTDVEQKPARGTEKGPVLVYRIDEILDDEVHRDEPWRPVRREEPLEGTGGLALQ